MYSVQDPKKSLQPDRNLSDIRGDRVYAVFPGTSQNLLDENVEVHGITGRDILEGHCCEQCWTYARTKEEYEQAVLTVHGVRPVSKD